MPVFRQPRNFKCSQKNLILRYYSTVHKEIKQWKIITYHCHYSRVESKLTYSVID